MGTNTSKVISARVRKARENLGINQAEFAERASITRAAISQIESGLRTPSTPILRRLASELEVSVDYLLGSSDESSIAELLNDETIQKFFRDYKELSKEDKKFIQTQIEFLKEKSHKK